MKTQISLLLGALLLASAACDNDPAKGKAQATVAPQSTTLTQSATTNAGPATTYTFNQDNSQVKFVGAKVTRKHDGGFGTFNGTIQLVGNDPTKSSVQVDIDVASITTDEAKLTGHLKTPDLLDAQKFPKARFTSTSIVPGGANGATHTVSGNFELHGVTKQISFPATIKVAPDAVRVDAEFAINRKDFGIVYPGMPDDLIKDEVLIKLKLDAAKKA